MFGKGRLCVLFLGKTKNMLAWTHQEPGDYLGEISSIIGPPTDVSNVPGGLAYWNDATLASRGSCFVRHELQDELIPHDKPAKHVDYFYSFIDYQVPDKKIWDVLRLSGSVSYDPLKGWLRARCANIEANIATLWMAIQIAQGKTTIKKVQRQGLYAQAIRSTKDSGQVQAMLKDICQAIANQQGMKALSCWNLAFPGEC